MIKTISINFRPDDEESLSIIERICLIADDRNIRVMLPDYPMLKDTVLKKYIFLYLTRSCVRQNLLLMKASNTH